MSNPLVTVLTPCYNGEKYLVTYFNSILAQDYDNIQLILVNDGSTDKTVDIVESYREKLEKELTDFVFITQENQGQAAACKNALPLIKGKYLIWPDVDDILTDNAISYKVDFLQSNPQYGYCRANAQCIDENGNKGTIFVRHNMDKHYLFEDFITQNDINGWAGVHMMDFDLFKEVNPNLDFYVGRGGQNWQFLLPIAYKNKCGFINEIQYYYLIHSDSHSHSNNTYEKEYNYTVYQEKIIRETLRILNLTDKEKAYYDKLIDDKYYHLRYSLSWVYKDKSYKKNFKELRKNSNVTIAEAVKYIIMLLRVR